MPGMSGQEFYQLVGEVDPALCPKIIFITGDRARPEVRDFVAGTGNPVLAKPFNIQELRRQVKDLERTIMVGDEV